MLHMLNRTGMIGVDVGGTFTDVIAVTADGIRATKVPTNPRRMYDPVIEGAKQVGLDDIHIFNHASTAGLNAVITRRLPKIGFLTTLGHRDILDMGRAWRPLEALTNADWRRSFGDVSAPLVPRYLRRGIRERIRSTGEVMIALDEKQALAELEILRKCHVEGVAICLLNAYVNPEHELQLKNLVQEVLGNVPCSISSFVSPLAKEYSRASTTVIDVFMKLIYGDYSQELIHGLRASGFSGQMNFADCAATLVPSQIAMEKPHRIVFSGPASGTVSSAYFGQLIGEANVICCDVGGTSCDISIVTDGKPTVTTLFELEHDLVVNTLTNEVISIGAGGGSIVSINKLGELIVGPESAGADPGPACYRKGGTRPTLTDACLMIGILADGQSLGGRIQLDRSLSENAFESLDTNLDLGQRVKFAYEMGLNNISEGIVNVAVKHGIDPRDYSIVAYGSAGPMILPAILDVVGARRILVPPYPGLFSALGLLSSDLVYTESQTAYVTLSSDVAEQVYHMFLSMEEGLIAQLGQDIDKSQIRVHRTFDGHLAGQTWETPFVDVPSGRIEGPTIDQMIANFHAAYEQHWGNRFEGLPVIGVTFRVQIIAPTPKVQYPELPERAPGEPLKPVDHTTLRYLTDEPIIAPVYHREDLRRKDVIEGPAIIREAMSTIQVGVGQMAQVGRYSEIVITQKG